MQISELPFNFTHQSDGIDARRTLGTTPIAKCPMETARRMRTESGAEWQMKAAYGDGVVIFGRLLGGRLIVVVCIRTGGSTGDPGWSLCLMFWRQTGEKEHDKIWRHTSRLVEWEMYLRLLGKML